MLPVANPPGPRSANEGGNTVPELQRAQQTVGMLRQLLLGHRRKEAAAVADAARAAATHAKLWELYRQDHAAHRKHIEVLAGELRLMEHHLQGGGSA
jgi:hypothetical protein